MIGSPESTTRRIGQWIRATTRIEESAEQVQVQPVRTGADLGWSTKWTCGAATRRLDCANGWSWTVLAR